MPNISNQVQYNLPQADEIELSLFGPGIGESIVAHIGGNEWIIIDSCIESKSKEPIPLYYLKRIGVNPSEDVKLVVISHWHSDHIRGASQIVKECKSASICFSEALLKEEFLTLFETYSGIKTLKTLDKENCGTKEISSIIKIILTRIEQNKGSGLTPYNLTSADKRIYQNKENNVEVWALSPSSQSIVNSLAEIAKLIPPPSEKDNRKVIPKPTKNLNATVLLIKCGKSNNFLLGSDLEETNDYLTGWSVIVNSNNRPSEKANVFKIPHHGSENAHSDPVWQKMVDTEAIGILTTKLGSISTIPKSSDIKRLKKYASELYCTLEPIGKKQKRDNTVEKTIKGFIKRSIPLNGEIGQIQLRMKRGSAVTIGLSGPAVKL